MKPFNDLGLAGSLLQAVTAEGYEAPTPIQAAVIAVMPASKDILAIAQTGTKKTTSSALPLLDHLIRRRRTPGARRCVALILAPTREVAAQTAASIQTCGRFTRPSTVVTIGSAKPGPQMRAMAGGVDNGIVFTRINRGAGKINQHLQKTELVADALHGGKSQGQRLRALAGYRSGRVKVPVATDIAARGIDLDDVSHVVNYQLPDVPEAYTHRIGRTARAGKSDIAVSLCDTSERALVRDIEGLIGRRLNGSPGQASASRQGAGETTTRSSIGGAGAQPVTDAPRPSAAPSWQSSGCGDIRTVHIAARQSTGRPMPETCMFHHS